MITRVRVRNFRSLADVDVTLGPLTVLVGRNGAGKSTFLDVLRFVRDALQIGLEDAIGLRGGITSLRRWSPRRPFDIEVALTLQTPGFWAEYAFALGGEGQDGYRVKREICHIRDSSFSVLVEERYETKDGKWVNLPEGSFLDERSSIEQTTLFLPLLTIVSSYAHPLRQHLRGNFYNIFPNTMRRPRAPSNETTLEDGGENFATVLRHIRKTSEYFPDLLASLRRVVDGVSDVRVRLTGGYLLTELEHREISRGMVEPRLGNTPDGVENGARASSTASKEKKERGPWFGLEQESDGTLRMLGMLVALYQDTPQHSFQPTLLALEEPETALHPGALAVLSDVIREATSRRQILITTQSPDLISRFNVDELRVVERSNGVTQIGPVDEVQRATIEEQLFSAGDLLRIEGLRREPVATADGGSGA